jgi:hypothetical protein
MIIPSHPPEDPVKRYIETQLPGYLKSIPAPPAPLYSYVINPATQSLNSSIVVYSFTIAPSGLSLWFNTKLSSVTVQFSVGDVGGNTNDLFLAPTVDANNNVTAHPVTYAHSSDLSDFTVEGSAIPSTDDGSMTFFIKSTNGSAGSLVAFTGITITIAGTNISTGGVATLNVTEDTVGRYDAANNPIPASNVATELIVKRA